MAIQQSLDRALLCVRIRDHQAGFAPRCKRCSSGVAAVRDLDEVRPASIGREAPELEVHIEECGAQPVIQRSLDDAELQMDRHQVEAGEEGAREIADGELEYARAYQLVELCRRHRGWRRG